MTRLHFTPDDVARTRLSDTPVPLVETVMGLVVLQRPAAGQAQWWRTQARRRFPATARPLLDLIPANGYWPEFLDPPVSDLETALDLVCATPRRVLHGQVAKAWRRPGRPPWWLHALAGGKREALLTVRRGLRDFHAACVAPYWPQVLASFHGDVAERTDVLVTRGLGEFFSAVHPDLSWRDSTLERHWRAGEFWLGGRGLRVLPSALWAGPPLFSVRPDNAGGNTLIYSAKAAAPPDDRADSRDLTGLLGRKRAAALAALRTPCGTLELAARTGVGASSASEHAAVLRKAGLIRTVRTGRGVCHSLTPLGRSLLNGTEPQGLRPGGEAAVG